MWFVLQQMLDVNFTGPMVLTQEVVRGMKVQQEGGVVVFVSSQAGLFGLFGFSAYAASKAAIVRAAEALHMEVSYINVHFVIAVKMYNTMCTVDILYVFYNDLFVCI